MFFFLLVAQENNSIPKITRKNNTSKSNSKKIDEVRKKSQEKIQQNKSKKKYLLTDTCNLTNHLSSSDSSISTNNNNEENLSRKIKRPIKGYQTVRFQDNSICGKKTSVSKADSSCEQFSPRVSPKFQKVTEVKKTALPGSPKESKHKTNKIQISGPSPYKPFGAATPTPIVTLKGY